MISGHSKIALAIVAVLTVSTCASPGSPRGRRALGCPPTKLRRITVEAERQIKKGNLAGMVSLFARRGQIVYLEPVRHQDREKNVPMRGDTIFRIASMTKPITSLSILMLYEEGEVQLTDPVSKYIGEFKKMNVWSPTGAGDVAVSTS